MKLATIISIRIRMLRYLYSTGESLASPRHGRIRAKVARYSNQLAPSWG